MQTKDKLYSAEEVHQSLEETIDIFALFKEKVQEIERNFGGEIGFSWNIKRENMQFGETVPFLDVFPISQVSVEAIKDLSELHRLQKSVRDKPIHQDRRIRLK